MEGGRTQEDSASKGRLTFDLCSPVGRAVQYPSHAGHCELMPVVLDSQRSPEGNQMAPFQLGSPSLRKKVLNLPYLSYICYDS